MIVRKIIKKNVKNIAVDGGSVDVGSHFVALALFDWRFFLRQIFQMAPSTLLGSPLLLG